MKPIVAARHPIHVDLKAGTEYHWCRCGRSKNQPWCDGSHEGTGFSPLAFIAEKDGEASLCRCKQTHNGPWCDGHHREVPSAKDGREFVLDGNTSVALAFGLKPDAEDLARPED